MLTKQDIQNILALISKTNITGQEATTTALLQQKLMSMLNQPQIAEENKEEPEEEK